MERLQQSSLLDSRKDLLRRVLELRMSEGNVAQKHQIAKGSVYHISQLTLLISVEFILLKQRIAYEDTDAFHGIQ